MILQTSTLREAETQLRDLVKQARITHQPVVLTTEETAEPVALLSPLPDEQMDQANSIAHRLEIMESILQAWQQSLDAPDIWPGYAHLFHSQLRLLSQTASDDQPTFGALVMLLRLAIRQLRESGSQAQLKALQRGLELLQSPDLTPDHIREVDQSLLDSGILARADFGDEELLRLYVEST